MIVSFKNEKLDPLPFVVLKIKQFFNGFLEYKTKKEGHGYESFFPKNHNVSHIIRTVNIVQVNWMS